MRSHRISWVGAPSQFISSCKARRVRSRKSRGLPSRAVTRGGCLSCNDMRTKILAMQGMYFGLARKSVAFSIRAIRVLFSHGKHPHGNKTLHSKACHKSSEISCKATSTQGVARRCIHTQPQILFDFDSNDSRLSSTIGIGNNLLFPSMQYAIQYQLNHFIVHTLFKH